MTREKVAEKLRWKLWTKVAGLLNAFLMAPQLAKIMSTGHSAGVSFGMLWLVAGIQVFFSTHGYFIRDRLVFLSNGIAAVVTVMTIIAAHFYP